MTQTTYSVHKTVGKGEILICLDGYGPSENEGYQDVGTFDLPIDTENASANAQTLNGPNGDHILVYEAKKLLKEHEDHEMSGLDHDKLTYLDRASNAPIHMDSSMEISSNHDQLTGSTDDLPTSVGKTHPEYSAQAGGEGNTGLPPEELEPNGVTPVEGAETPENPEDGTKEEDSQSEHHSSETVDELKERISKINDTHLLQQELSDEQSGKDRTTAKQAIEDRIEEVADKTK